jgi:hypothetical protein
LVHIKQNSQIGKKENVSTKKSRKGKEDKKESKNKIKKIKIKKQPTRSVDNVTNEKCVKIKYLLLLVIAS